MLSPFRLALLIAISFGCGVYLGRVFKYNSDPISPVTPKWIHNLSPDPELFEVVKRGLEKYSKNRETISEFTLNPDPNTGFVETGWYRDHKGEIRLKAQVFVWGKNYRIDVWQRIQFTGEVAKTEWSRMSEKEIQNAIEESRNGS